MTELLNIIHFFWFMLDYSVSAMSEAFVIVDCSLY